LLIDNLKSAVLQRLAGVAPVFNPKYLDFSRHWDFEISACNVRSGNKKGRVENGVGYVKKNFHCGLEWYYLFGSGLGNRHGFKDFRHA